MLFNTLKRSLINLIFLSTSATCSAATATFRSVAVAPNSCHSRSNSWSVNAVIMWNPRFW